jgi:adenosylhomocysteine nucleosidase
MREIVGHFPEAKAVDMESCAIAQTCYINKVPFISFRIISDIPLRDTNASQYHNFWENMAERSFQVTKRFVESLL